MENRKIVYDIDYEKDEDSNVISIYSESDNNSILDCGNIRKNYNENKEQLKFSITNNKKKCNQIPFKQKVINNQTNQKNSLKNNIYEKNDNIMEKRNAPDKYNLEKIKELIKRNIELDKYNEIIKNIVYDKNIENAENNLELIKKKRKRPSEEEFEMILCNLKNKIGKGKRRGRERKNYNNIEYHNKYSSDNMMKKVKGSLIGYCLSFINRMLDKYKEGKKDVLLRLDYKIIDTINIEKDLNILNMPLKDLFSNKISPKNKTKINERDYNKKKLEKILKQETDDTVIFTLNMRFIDWVDIFTFKKNIKDVINKYDINNNKYINLERIDNNLIKIDNLLIKKTEKNLDEFTLFLFYLYNYERWFKIKEPREKKIKQNNM